MTNYYIFVHILFFMRNTYISFIAILLTICVDAQDYNSYYQSIVDQVNFEILDQNLETHESFGSKQPGTDALLNSFNWLKGNYENWGYTDIVIDTFYYSGHECYNLIVTKTGVKYPNEYLIIDGHYDTRNGPGANDNGTGTSIVLECARLLKNIETDYSIRFIHFSAEEVGLIGSNHYVDHVVVPENHNIRLVFNIDAIGGVNGMVNDIIVCEHDESYPHENDWASSQYTDTLSVIMEMYSDLLTDISYAYATDYVPFMEAGYVVTGLYEFNETPYAHTPNDVIENMDLDYFHEVAKGSIAASLFFGGAHNYTSVNEEENQKFIIFPNPTTQYVNISKNDDIEIKEIHIYNREGAKVYSITNIERDQIDIKHLNKGLYLIQFILDNHQMIIKKINKMN